MTRYPDSLAVGRFINKGETKTAVLVMMPEDISHNIRECCKDTA
jgi:hypothetical protein